jgi:homoserine kinase
VEAPNLILTAARAVFADLDRPYPGFRLRCVNRVPMRGGLGSSAAAIACGLLLANRSLGDPLPEPDLLRLATAVEGHPDNVAPCLLGGVRVAVLTEAHGVIQAPIPAPADLRAVVFVPERTLATHQARAALPVIVPFEDALFNVGRTSLLVAALAAGRLDLLAQAMQDRLHQPFRAPLFPPARALIERALEAGALGACVSGAGPSILALCSLDTASAISAALAAAAAELAEPGRTLSLALSQRGAYVV